MTSPRFVPRAESATPQLFGKSRRIVWRDLTNRSDSALDQHFAAKLQHEYALSVNQGLSRVDQSLREYCLTYGLDYTRWGRVLRGTVIMRLEDVVNAERNLGIRLTFADVEN